MKTNTLLKRTIKIVGFLTILLVLLSFKNEKRASEIYLEHVNELAMRMEAPVNLAVPHKNSVMDVERRDTHILLTIDTENIDEGNLNATIVFSDDRSDPSENPGNPEKFTSVVDKNMKIYWSGIPKDENSTDVIYILEVIRKQQGGAEILKKTFKDPNKDGVVVGKVKNKKVEGFEYYSVKFSINGTTVRTFEVDPKLKMGIEAE
ncbi:hypothetical protein JM83_2683 [Gillisia sp. Hel_I_86]|uniref:hypothetical protein n=1 Tax=Gillisia sp. Hel_I_86 TaxID=1249981 RepID=UPI00119B33CE|nr:hypothetical protein [Gillisia sp. Hel_I_86]TVZ27633.1 hypothetical protein JM83_2683 [Gillisia sp. Hel_I_86]